MVCSTSVMGVCNRWDWTGLTFCTNCIHDNATISCVIVYCVCCYFEDALQPHIASPQSARRGEQRGGGGGGGRLEHTPC